ncbi:uncharacterized protein stbd1 [Genypterus blacodes]|uniref:uncharacterized protein stbd1 n=1 Tax=Genypterus blacodes TaxID=154954 RepID=UPI003F76E113
MTLTNSKSVALERRMDLASLFCMIGRHGPAVAVAAIAMISLLAAFVIYRRTVRWKRGKAKAAAAGRDAKSRAEEPDATVSREDAEEEGEAEEEDTIPAESTEVDDEASPSLWKDPDLLQDRLNIRQRCTAAAAEDSFSALEAVEKKLPLHSSPRCEDEIPENTHTASGASLRPERDDTPSRTAETDRDLISQHQRPTEPETEKEEEEEQEEDVFNAPQDIKDQTEVIHYNDSSLKESTDDEKKEEDEEEEQVCEAAHMEEDEDETTDEGSSHVNTREEEETVQCVMKNLLNQALCVSENGDDVRLQEDKDSEPVNGVKDEDEEEHQCPDNTVNTDYCKDSNVKAEEEEEGEEECVDHQLIRPIKQEETQSSSSQPPVFHEQLDEEQDRTNHVTDSSDVLDNDDEGGVTAQVIEEDIVKDVDLTAAECDREQPQCQENDEEEGEAEGQVTDKELTEEDVVAACVSAEEDHSQTSEPEQVEGGDEGRPGVEICSVSSSSQQNDGIDETSHLLEDDPEQCEPAAEHNTLEDDSPSSCQGKHRQGGQEIDEEFETGIKGVATSPDIPVSEETSVVFHRAPAARVGDRVSAAAETQETTHPQLSSLNQLSAQNDDEANMTSSLNIDAAADVDGMSCPSLSSSHQDHQTVKEEASDESNMVSDPETVTLHDGDVTSCPPCQNEEHVQSVNSEALDKEDGCTGPETAPPYDDVPVMLEDAACPPLLSPCQDQQSVQQIEDGSVPDPVDPDAACPLLLSLCQDQQSVQQIEDGSVPDPVDPDAACPLLLSLCQDQQSVQQIEDGSVPDPVASDIPVTLEETSCPSLPPSLHQDQDGDHVVNDDALDEDASTETSARHDQTFIIPVIVEDVSCPPVPSFYQDQQSDQTANTEALDESRDDAGPDTLTAVEEEVHVPVMDDQTSSPVSYQDQESGQTRDNEGLEKETAGPAEVSCDSDEESSLSFKDQQSSPTVDNEDSTAEVAAPVTTEEINHLHSLSFDQHEQRGDDLDNNMSSPGVDEETDFSPDSEEPSEDVEFHHSISSLSVTDEDGSIRRLVSVDEAICVSFGDNEDVFGRDIEDRYHGEFDQFMAQIAASIGGRSYEQPGEKEVDVSEVKEKKEGKKTEELHRTEHQLDVTVTVATTDAVGTDATDGDIEFTEHKQTSTLSVADDEGKKVVAVSTPQNVDVTFCVHYLTCSPHQTVAVTGNQQELGSWKGFVRLERAKDGYWASVIRLPAERRVDWKFVVVDGEEVCRWEECANRRLETGGGDDVYLQELWGFL